MLLSGFFFTEITLVFICLITLVLNLGLILLNLTVEAIDPFLLLAAIIPIKTYSNAEVDKGKILKENKNKSDIYMWKKNINNKKYIDSSENLRKRFLNYFNTNHLLKNKSMYICNSLIKHGYSNFSLTTLEYCSPDKCLEIEGYYFKSEKPEYNIAQDPSAPMSGRKHSEETKKIISDALKGITGENHSRFGKNHSEETKKQISDALVGNTNKKGQTLSFGAMILKKKYLMLLQVNKK